MNMASVIEKVPQLKRGIVWCKKCGASGPTNMQYNCAHGWPKCCGETMTIDSPEERAKPEAVPVTEEVSA